MVDYIGASCTIPNNICSTVTPASSINMNKMGKMSFGHAVMAGSWRDWFGYLSTCRRTIRFERNMCSNCRRWPQPLLRCRAVTVYGARDFSMPRPIRLPENSGSAFITYALAYGVREHLLDRKRYLPVVKKAWAAFSLTFMKMGVSAASSQSAQLQESFHGHVKLCIRRRRLLACRLGDLQACETDAN